MKHKLTLIALTIALMVSTNPAQSIIDIDQFFAMFKKQHKQTIHIINHDEADIEITEAEIMDKGSDRFRNLREVYNTYSISVKNTGNREILSYQVAWTMKHPFENFVYKKITTNSIDVIKPGESQSIEIRRDKHFRDDAYYYVEISKVEYDDDETIWEAPEREETIARLDKIKQEIDAIEEKSIEDMSVDEIKDAMKNAPSEDE